jgi:hypothetical protein
MKIILDIKGTDITFDLDEAEKLYNELDKIFGAKTPFWKDWQEIPRPSYAPGFNEWPPMTITSDDKSS